jgi:threonine aldolase
VASLCAGATTVSVCLSKGLGAPLGSVLVGPAAVLKRARRARKALGGGMRQAGVVAAAGLYALSDASGHVLRLQEDHALAARLAQRLEQAGYTLAHDVATNIVYFAPPPGHAMTAATLPGAMQARGVLCGGGYGSGGDLIRVVVHRDLSPSQLDWAADAFEQALGYYS